MLSLVKPEINSSVSTYSVLPFVHSFMFIYSFVFVGISYCYIPGNHPGQEYDSGLFSHFHTRSSGKTVGATIFYLPGDLGRIGSLSFMGFHT